MTSGSRPAPRSTARRAGEAEARTTRTLRPYITRRMRFGLVGTGYWARATHAAAIASTPGASLEAVWGRNPQATASLAAEHGAAAFTGEEAIDAFLDGVDAVAFSVPPYVQAPIATPAAPAPRPRAAPSTRPRPPPPGTRRWPP